MTEPISFEVHLSLGRIVISNAVGFYTHEGLVVIETLCLETGEVRKDHAFAINKLTSITRI